MARYIDLFADKFQRESSSQSDPINTFAIVNYKVRHQVSLAVAQRNPQGVEMRHICKLFSAFTYVASQLPVAYPRKYIFIFVKQCILVHNFSFLIRCSMITGAPSKKIRSETKGKSKLFSRNFEFLITLF